MCVCLCVGLGMDAHFSLTHVGAISWARHQAACEHKPKCLGACTRVHRPVCVCVHIQYYAIKPPHGPLLSLVCHSLYSSNPACRSPTLYPMALDPMWHARENHIGIESHKTQQRASHAGGRSQLFSTMVSTCACVCISLFLPLTPSACLTAYKALQRIYNSAETPLSTVYAPCLPCIFQSSPAARPSRSLCCQPSVSCFGGV